MPRKPKVSIGSRYGKLVTIRKEGQFYECACDCGNGDVSVGEEWARRVVYQRMLAAAPQPRPDWIACSDKYTNVLLPFLRQMDAELHANADKGDRPGWLSLSREQVMLEIYYHASKLQKAMKSDDQQGIREYSADVANMAMMALDICGGLDVEPARTTGGQHQ